MVFDGRQQRGISGLKKCVYRGYLKGPDRRTDRISDLAAVSGRKYKIKGLIRIAGEDREYETSDTHRKRR